MTKTLSARFALALLTGQAQAKDVAFQTEVASMLMKHRYECHGGT